MNDDARRSDPTRVLARRTLAWLIDVFVFIATFVATVVVFGERFTGTGIAARPDGFRFERGDATLWFPKGVPAVGDSVLVVPGNKFWLAVGLFWVVLLVDWVIVQGLTGRTAGKSLCRVRCVTREQARPGIGRALLRTILWPIDLIDIVLPLAFILATFTKGHRRVGDFAAGTFVVDRAFADRLAGHHTDDRPERIPASEVELAGGDGDDLEHEDEFDADLVADTGGRPPSVFEPAPSTPPAAEPAAPAAAAAAPATATPGPTRERSLEPVWNESLDTYVRWEPSVERWIGWDEAAQKWRLVDPSRMG